MDKKTPSSRAPFILPDGVMAVLSRLHGAGYEAYVVGGAVRDYLRGVTPHDYDLTTSATPEEMHRVFADLRLIDTGIQHGTVTVMVDGEPHEVTTYRLDGEYHDSRHPDAVTFTRSLTEDLSRRDFTVNAVAYSPEAGLCDPFGGEGDIAARRIVAVGDPYRRFEEDALRILRALRFSACLSFAIEKETAAAARALAPRLRLLSGERIREEMNRLLVGESAPTVLAEFSDILATLFPAWGEAVGEAYGAGRMSRIARILPLLPTDCALRWAAFLLPMRDLPDAPRAWEALLSTLHFSRRTEDRILKFLAHTDDPSTGEKRTVRRFLAGLGEADAPLLLSLQRALAVLDGADTTPYDLAEAALLSLIKGGAVYGIADLAVRGADLLAAGIPPGARVGRLLTLALEAVLDGRVPNEREALLAYLLSQK